MPPALGSAFSVKTATDAGVSPRRLRARDLDRPFRGVRVRSAPVPADGEDVHAQRALAYAVALPDGQFFSHVTAAVLWGLPLPASAIRPAEVDVAVLAPGRTPRGARIRGHRMVQASTRVCVHPQLGVPLLAPTSTWASLGAVLDVRDLVAVADAIVRVPMFRGDPPPLATIDDLAAASTGRRVGIARLRAALPLVRERSASRPETWCRLALIDGGLPEPELNWNIVVNGRLVACVDLAYPRERVAVEYDGEHHLVDARQWSRDIGRHEALAAAGWIVIRVTKQHLFTDAAGVVARVRRALAGR
ncbi:endonuclease domain-containing protein [Microbacterium sp. NPDC077663]|uniref:endonuclease domain-containing protein n=1 Tax=Microbacterium sp. NPDC077663 TaxID=3364189 RepID=UPI0037CB6868